MQDIEEEKVEKYTIDADTQRYHTQITTQKSSKDQWFADNTREAIPSTDNAPKEFNISKRLA